MHRSGIWFQASTIRLYLNNSTVNASWILGDVCCLVPLSWGRYNFFCNWCSEWCY